MKNTNILFLKFLLNLWIFWQEFSHNNVIAFGSFTNYTNPQCFTRKNKCVMIENLSSDSFRINPISWKPASENGHKMCFKRNMMDLTGFRTLWDMKKHYEIRFIPVGCLYFSVSMMHDSRKIFSITFFVVMIYRMHVFLSHF